MPQTAVVAVRHGDQLTPGTCSATLVSPRPGAGADKSDFDVVVRRNQRGRLIFDLRQHVHPGSGDGLRGSRAYSLKKVPAIQLLHEFLSPQGSCPTAAPRACG